MSDMFFKLNYFAVDYSPNGIIVYTKIFMNEEIAHSCYVTPCYFRMFFLKRLAKHISSLSDDFNILDDTIIAQDVCFQFLARQVAGVFLQALYGLKHMFKPGSVSKRLSHKSKFYHGQHSRGQKAISPCQ